MSTTFYPVILFAQAPTNIHVRLVYSEEESADFYSEFNSQGNRIISLPTLQNWFSEKIKVQNSLLLKFMQSEGFHITDPDLYQDEDDYKVEKRVVFRKALEVFGNEEKTERWMNRRNRALKNKRPSDLYGSLGGLVQLNKLLITMVKNPSSRRFITGV